MKTLTEVWEVWENRPWILRWPTETSTTGNCYLPGGGGVFKSEPGESRAGPQMMRFPVAAVVSRDEAPAREMESGKEGTRENIPTISFPFLESPAGALISSVQSLSCVWLFATPWAAACQASLSITNSRSLLKLMSIQSVYAIPASESFPESQASGGQSTGVSASTSVLPMGIQDWFPLGWIGLISLLSKSLSRVFSNTTVQKHQFFSTQPSLWFNSHIHTWLLENHSFDCKDLCQQSDVSTF